MSENDPGTITDGNLSFEGGIDSGIPASLLGQNEVSWAVNTTMRGGFLKPRPGMVKRPLRFTDGTTLTNFETGRFQGAGTYYDTDGNPNFAVMVSGRTFKLSVTQNYLVSDISIPGDLNQPDAPHAWFQQAEQWLVAQDGITRPYLYNGSISRRSDPNTEVPVGGPMAYGKGRLWVARDNLYFGGDLVDTQTTGVDSVIQFTENDYLAEGGAFAVSGTITGMAFGANLDTSLGDGDLLVCTSDNVYAFNAPVDRTTWKNLSYPIQRFAMLKYGSMNHEGISVVNGDLLFRSQIGVMSLKYARRDFEGWGNSPISSEVVRGLENDTESRLYACSSTTFDNRFLMTILPQKDTGHGVWHMGLVALDFFTVSGIRKDFSPAWEGAWTGLRILRIITLTVNKVDRCFIFALNADDEIELWELTKKSKFDRDGTDDVRIKWVVEGKSYAFGKPDSPKRLLRGDVWFDDVTGEVSMTSRFRSDLGPCWTNWSRWTACTKYRDCDPVEAPDCQVPLSYKGQVRSQIALPSPPEVSTPEGSLSHTGYDIQWRLEFEGHLRMKRIKLTAVDQPDFVFGAMEGVECVENTDPDCPTGCATQACCDLDDFGYTI